MKTYQPILITSILAAAALARFQMVGFDGNVAAAGAAALGACDTDTDLGDEAPVAVSGILLVTAGAAIAVGAKVEVGTSGKVITNTTGVSCGYALDAAAADGDAIRIVRGI